MSYSRRKSSTDVEKNHTNQITLTAEEEEYHVAKTDLAKAVLAAVHGDESEEEEDTLAPPSKTIPVSHWHRRRSANAALAAAEEHINEGTVMGEEALKQQSTIRTKGKKGITAEEEEQHDELFATVSKAMNKTTKNLSGEAKAQINKVRELANDVSLAPTLSKIASKHSKNDKGATVAHEEIQHLIKTGGTENGKLTPLTHEKPVLVDPMGLRCVEHLKDPKWKQLARCIRETIYDPEFYDDGTYAPMYVRLAIHGAATWRHTDKSGGLEGGRMRFKPEWSDAHNKFCKPIVKRQHEMIKVPNPWASYADIQCLCAYVSIECAGGPVMQFTPGRRDAEDQGKENFVFLNYQVRGDTGLESDPAPNPNYNPTNPGDVCPFLEAMKIPPGRVLGPEEGHLGPARKPVLRENEEKEWKEVAHEIRKWFQGRIGTTDQYTVALISGGHSFGRCHPQISGYAGPWQSNPGYFNNVYCKKLLTEDWKIVDSTCKDYSGDLITGLKPKGMRRQYVNKGGKGDLMMLVSDMALRQDPEFRKWLEVYANDIEELKKDFATAFKMVTEVGEQGPLPPERTGGAAMVWNLRFKFAELLRWIGEVVCPDPEPAGGGGAADAAPLVGEPYTMDDVKPHNKKDDAWVVINKQVCNVTQFMNEHPGGVDVICANAGKDASAEWNTIHSAGTIQRIAPKTIIGHIK